MDNTSSSVYNHEIIESEIYNFWIKNNLFTSFPDNNKAYTIIMPPPNVTGSLHIGHILNNVIQDVLWRTAKMNKFNSCWVPSTDHASIATETKVMQELLTRGIDRNKLGKKKFISYIKSWCYKNIENIQNELKSIGVSCDWNRFKFTMDKDLSDSVKKVFIDLYNRKLIYRGYRVINWDCQALTSISDEEVYYKKILTKLYYIRYKLDGLNEYVIIATTRPETIFGDTALCIHPDDKRYSYLYNQKAIVPIINRKIPIILDKYVNSDFGTGCLKVTPAHDVDDYNIAIKHNLEIINIFNRDGTTNENTSKYKNIDRFVCRKMVIEKLLKLNLLFKVEDYSCNISLSQRTHTVIEPMISVQWFLKLKDISHDVLSFILNDKINLYPNKFKNIFLNWLNNLKDWNISRQLWWGHNIPVYYYGNGLQDYVVASNKKEAIDKIKIIHGSNKKFFIKQDTDVLDTWFSSWILPISLFNGILKPDNYEFKYYYPSKILVTGPDIIFFWVIKMMICGYLYTKKMPFNSIYFTGIIRDKNNNKMSKSLGNFPNTTKLINYYGADAVRVSLLLNNSMGNDFIFHENILFQGKEFIDKFWNVFLLIRRWKCDINISTFNHQFLIIKWLKNKFKKLFKFISENIKLFKVNSTFVKIYKFFKYDFCSIFLEIIKIKNSYFLSHKVYNNVLSIYKNILQIFHPYIPFITEKIFLLLFNTNKINNPKSLLSISLPILDFHDQEILDDVSHILKIVKKIRYFRKQFNILFTTKVKLFYNNKNNRYIKYKSLVVKLCNLSDVIFKSYSSIFNDYYYTFNILNYRYYIINNHVSFLQEKNKIINKINYYKCFLIKIRKILKNKNFLKKAPKNIIKKEFKKEQDILKLINSMKKNI